MKDVHTLQCQLALIRLRVCEEHRLRDVFQSPLQVRGQRAESASQDEGWGRALITTNNRIYTHVRLFAITGTYR